MANYIVKDNQTGKTMTVSPQDLGKYGLSLPKNAGQGWTQNPFIKSLVHGAADFLPDALGIAGAIGGGIAGAASGALDLGATSIPGAVAGGAAGGAAGQTVGKGLQQYLLQNVLGAETHTFADNLKQLGASTVEGGAFGAIPGAEEVKGAADVGKATVKEAAPSLLDKIVGKGAKIASTTANRAAVGAAAGGVATGVQDVASGKDLKTTAEDIGKSAFNTAVFNAVEFPVASKVLGKIGDFVGKGIPKDVQNYISKNSDALYKDIEKQMRPTMEKAAQAQAAAELFGADNVSKVVNDMGFYTSDPYLSRSSMKESLDFVNNHLQNTLGKQIGKVLGSYQADVSDAIGHIKGDLIGLDAPAKVSKIVNDWAKNIDPTLQKSGAVPVVSLADVNELKTKLGRYYNDKDGTAKSIVNYLRGFITDNMHEGNLTKAGKAALQEGQSAAQKAASDIQSFGQLNNEYNNFRDVRDHIQSMVDTTKFGLRHLDGKTYQSTEEGMNKALETELNREYNTRLQAMQKGNVVPMREFLNVIFGFPAAYLAWQTTKSWVVASGAHGAASAFSHLVTNQSLSRNARGNLRDLLQSKVGGSVMQQGGLRNPPDIFGILSGQNQNQNGQ